MSISTEVKLEKEMVDAGYNKFMEEVQSGRPPGPFYKAIGELLPALVQALSLELQQSARGRIVKLTHGLIGPPVVLSAVGFTLLSVLMSDANQEGINYQASCKRVVQDLMGIQAWAKWSMEQDPKALSRLKGKIRKYPQHVQTKFIQGITTEFNTTAYDQKTQVAVGGRLVEITVKSLPHVFERVTNYVGTNTQSTLIQFTEAFQRDYAEAIEVAANQMAKFRPMVVPPKPWGKGERGGYLTQVGPLKLDFIKTRHREALETASQANMNEVYRAVNALQDVPWRINQGILDVVLNKDKLPQACREMLFPDPETVPFPEIPWKSTEEKEVMKESNPEGYRKVKHEVDRYNALQKQAKGRKKATDLTVEIAQEYSEYPQFHYVYTLDWRGRIYTVQSYLTPMGQDLGKGLLEFAEGKPLGKYGLKWLAVHGANCFGVDKVSFEERCDWVDEHHQDIILTAQNPYKYGWWAIEADKPWQFLAFCFEWAESMEPDFKSHLSVNMDGSCNGLQHFTALGLDAEGARNVNVSPNEKPADVYSIILETVNELIEQDPDDEPMKAIWKGKTDRKIVKRPVMTVPYGVTAFGVTNQILEELKGRDADYLGKDVHLFQASQYLKGKVFQALGQRIASAECIMDWIKACAKVFNEAGLPLTWVTPSGFPALQTYYKTRQQSVQIYVDQHRFNVKVQEDTKKIDGGRQVNGASPNVVHSMDATHLVKTINRCLDQGITSFSAIHDSYGTHAGDVEDLQRIIRKAFHDLYSENVLANLHQQWQSQVPGVSLPKPPSQGDLDLSTVLASDYFFA